VVTELKNNILLKKKSLMWRLRWI